MPGKHAPDSSASFILSLTKTFGTIAAVLVLVVVVAVMAFGGNDGTDPIAEPTTPSTQGSEPEPTEEPTEEPTAEPTEEPSPSPEPTEDLTFEETTLPPPQVVANVMNGTNRGGLAGRTATRVREAGYKVDQIDNTPAREKSTIVYRPGAEDEARVLQDQFPEFTVIEEGEPSSSNAIVELIIGADFP